MFKKNKSKSIDQNKKPDKLRKNTGLKIARVLIWLVFGFIFLRGVINLTRPDPVKKMEESQEIFIKKMSQENSIQSKAFAFTESFAKEYFTHSIGGDEDYKKRLESYLPSYLLQDLKGTSNTSVLSSKAHDIEQYSENQFNVYVALKVQYKDSKQATVSENDVYVKVPVLYNNNFIVEDVPNVVASPNKGTADKQEFEGKSVETSLNNDINTNLTQFFKAYYELPQTQINYFLDSSISQDIKGLNGRFKFNKIDKANIFYDKDSETNFIAIVQFQVADIDGSLLTQKYNVKLTKKDGKYYVTELNTRSINLKDTKTND